jgi:hypothetical protein
MYARKVGAKPEIVLIPEANIPIGFDVISSDWVTPYGKGTSSDFIFLLQRSFTSAEKPFTATLTVTFANDGDGIRSVLVSPFAGSELRLPRYAPDTGYERRIVLRTERLATDKPIKNESRDDQNYFFRVRSVLDERKQIKSALYGKIYGDIGFDVINGNPAYLFFTYYLNPAPNDRNMEFDPKRNLFPNLNDLEKPSAP